MDELGQTPRFHQHRDLSLKWLLDHPVKTLNWNGYYEDIGNNPKNRNNWDCIDTIRYLLSHRERHPEYLPLARRLNAYIERTFIDRDHPYTPAEGIREQKACFVTMGVHSAHWAAMMADLYHATGEERYRQRAIQTMNYVTYHLQPDNRIVIGFSYNQWWYSGHFGSILYLLDFMANLPEMAPAGQNHLLQTSAGVRTIEYLDHAVLYKTSAAESSDILKLAAAPKTILVDGSPATDWHYRGETGILRLHHKGKNVEIRQF